MSESRPDPLNTLAENVLAKNAHAVVEQTLDGEIRELPPATMGREEPVAVRSLTNSPRCEPRPETGVCTSTSRRLRKVRVDAWAEPASVSWTRNRTKVRKVSRTSRSAASCSTDWALPF